MYIYITGRALNEAAAMPRNRGRNWPFNAEWSATHDPHRPLDKGWSLSTTVLNDRAQTATERTMLDPYYANPAWRTVYYRIHNTPEARSFLREVEYVCHERRHVNEAPEYVELTSDRLNFLQMVQNEVSLFDARIEVYRDNAWQGIMPGVVDRLRPGLRCRVLRAVIDHPRLMAIELREDGPSAVAQTKGLAQKTRTLLFDDPTEVP